MNEKNIFAIIITQHAYDRGKERLGLSEKAMKRTAEKAYETGKRHNDFTGRMEKYITSLYFKNKTANNIRIHGEHVFIFCHNKLLTVHIVPNELKKLIK